MSHNLQNTTEHKAYNHTQSFSPAGTQCLPPPYTIHRAYAIFRDASAHKAPHPKQSSVLFHPPFTELSPYRNITFRNTELVIEHRASFIIFIEHRASLVHIAKLCASSPPYTELLPRGNTVLNLHHTQYTELLLPGTQSFTSHPSR